jgi:hypothetical protein
MRYAYSGMAAISSLILNIVLLRARCWQTIASQFDATGVHCGHFPAPGNDFRASVFSKGDAENRIVGGGERHTPDTQQA